MLDQFTWAIPETSVGAYSLPSIKVIVREKNESAKTSAKHSFVMNKAFCKKYNIVGDVAAAFSFIDKKEIMMALDVPDTIPSYPLRETTSEAHLFANARFCQTLMKHVSDEKEIQKKDGAYHFAFEWEELETVDKVRFFKLKRRNT